MNKNKELLSQVPVWLQSVRGRQETSGVLLQCFSASFLRTKFSWNGCCEVNKRKNLCVRSLYCAVTSIFKVCLHIPSPFPSLSQCPQSLTLCQWLTSRMGPRPILPVKLSVSISAMLNFDGHCDREGNGLGMCKHTLRPEKLWYIPSESYYALFFLAAISHLW